MYRHVFVGFFIGALSVTIFGYFIDFVWPVSRITTGLLLPGALLCIPVTMGMGNATLEAFSAGFKCASILMPAIYGGILGAVVGIVLANVRKSRMV